EAGLVTGMARGRGSATRLADIADVKRRLTGRAHFFRQGPDEVERDGLAPVAVAAGANRLLTPPAERQGLRALPAAGRIEADRLGGAGGGRRHLTPFLGRRREGRE